MRYVVTPAGVVHEEGRHGRDGDQPWDPAKQHLMPGVRACGFCLSGELPVAPTEPVYLLEDLDGAPYPEEVQAFWRELVGDLGYEIQRELVVALESVAWYAWRDGNEAALVHGKAAAENPHRAPEGEL